MGFGRLLEFFKSGDGDAVVDEGTDRVRFLESELPVGRTGIGIEPPFAGREPRELPNELDLSIVELLVNFNGLGPLDKDCASCGRSITPNSDVLGTPLEDGFALNVRGTCVDDTPG